jgi:hypothetical protein
MFGHVMHHLCMLCLALTMQVMYSSMSHGVILRVVVFIVGTCESVVSCVYT